MALPQQDYSTLETVGARHSTLEPYYPPSSPRSPYNGAEAYYSPDAPAYAQKEADYSQSAAGPAVTMPRERRRYCGMTWKIAILVLVIVLLVIVGAIVGAVVGTRSKDKSSTPPDPTTTNLRGGDITDPSSSSSSSPSSATSGGGFTLPTTTFQCPAFVENFRSDYWYTFGTRHSNRTDYNLRSVYLAGSYKHDQEKGTVRSLLLYNNTQLVNTQMQWQFRRLDREPLGQLGCNDTVKQKKRLYKIACRLEDTAQDAGTTLALDPVTRSSDKPRVSLVKKDDADLTQLWYVDYKNETGWDWYEIRNYEGGWRLAAYTGDAEPWMEERGTVYTKFGGDMTMELIGEEWL